jgi:hypothetical protein
MHRNIKECQCCMNQSVLFPSVNSSQKMGTHPHRHIYFIEQKGCWWHRTYQWPLLPAACTHKRHRWRATANQSQQMVLICSWDVFTSVLGPISEEYQRSEKEMCLTKKCIGMWSWESILIKMSILSFSQLHISKSPIRFIIWWEAANVLMKRNYDYLQDRS